MFGLLDQCLDLPKYTKCLNNQCTFELVIGFREGEKRNNVLVLQSGEPWYPRHAFSFGSDWFGFACRMLISFISVVGKLQTGCYIRKFYFYLSNWTYRTILLFDNPSLFRNVCPSCAVLGNVIFKVCYFQYNITSIRLFGNAFKIEEQKLIWHSLYAMTCILSKNLGSGFYFFLGGGGNKLLLFGNDALHWLN